MSSEDTPYVSHQFRCVRCRFTLAEFVVVVYMEFENGRFYFLFVVRNAVQHMLNSLRVFCSARRWWSTKSFRLNYKKKVGKLIYECWSETINDRLKDTECVVFTIFPFVWSSPPVSLRSFESRQQAEIFWNSQKTSRPGRKGIRRHKTRIMILCSSQKRRNKTRFIALICETCHILEFPVCQFCCRSPGGPILSGQCVCQLKIVIFKSEKGNGCSFVGFTVC